MILVVGSAHLDVLGKITGDDLAIDKPGTANISIGGTACNIALNIARAGVPCRLLTALGNSVYSDLTVQHLISGGVTPDVDWNADLGIAAFIAHIDSNGQLYSAVSDMPVENHVFEPQRVLRAMESASAVVLDCNLNGNTLDQIVHLCNETSKPVYVAAVSEEKSTRLRAITGEVAAAFMNWTEAAYLRKSISVLLPTRNYAEMSAALGMPLVVTQGAERYVVIADMSSQTRVVDECDTQFKGNDLGAGDAFTAGYIVGQIYKGMSNEEAARYGIECAHDVLALEHCNISELNAFDKSVERLHATAYKDALTGILNRAGYDRLVVSEDKLLSASPGYETGVALIDLDYFKQVNDQHGHAVGDEALKHIASIAASISCELGGQAARLGGDEFVCLIGGSNANLIGVLAEKIAQEARAPVPGLPKLSVSIGAAVSSAHVRAIREVMKDADKALYRVKEAGRDGYALHAAAASNPTAA